MPSGSICPCSAGRPTRFPQREPMCSGSQSRRVRCGSSREDDGGVGGRGRHCVKTFIGVVALTSACATASRGPTSAGVARCAPAPSTDTTVYDTSQVTWPAERASGAIPVYPISARENGVQGRVVIGMIIETTGEVNHSSVTVVQSPDARLTESALALVRHSRFRPACVGDRPVRFRLHLPIDYRVGLWRAGGPPYP
jgi:TonB family protein